MPGAGGPEVDGQTVIRIMAAKASVDRLNLFLQGSVPDLAHELRQPGMLR